MLSILGQIIILFIKIMFKDALLNLTSNKLRRICPNVFFGSLIFFNISNFFANFELEKLHD